LQKREEVLKLMAQNGSSTGAVMKREWEIEELIEHFSLSNSEMALLHRKKRHNQLLLAVLLKYFQHEGKFPTTKREIARSVVVFIAQQLEVETNEFDKYNWGGRTLKRDRALIRRYLGFRIGTRSDQTRLTEWLSVHPDMSHEHSTEYWLEIAYYRLGELQVEPFSPVKMERMVRSVLNRYQDKVCETIYGRLSPEMKDELDKLLEPDLFNSEDNKNPWSRLAKLKDDPSGTDLNNALQAGEKLRQLRSVNLPLNLFEGVDPKWVEVYRQRTTAEHPSDLKAHPAPIKYTFLAAFCLIRQTEITDQLVELLIQIIHKISTRAKHKIEKHIIKDIQRVYGKDEMLFKIAKATLASPQDRVVDVVFPVVSEAKLARVVEEHENQPLTYHQQVGQVMRRSYGQHYRQMLSIILETLLFRAKNELQPVLQALKVVEKYVHHPRLQFYPLDEQVPLEGIVHPHWRELVIVKRQRTADRIRRLDYELCVLGLLREKLRATVIWVEGASKHGNPDRVLLSDFDQKRESYYKQLKQPLKGGDFVDGLKTVLKKALTDFNTSITTNHYVKILSKGKGWIRLSPLPAQTEAPFLPVLKGEVERLWPMTNLLDVLKEADLRLHFTNEFKTLAERQILDNETLRKRLLLCLFGLGTNIGLKQTSAGDHEQTERDLQYVKRYFISREALRNANAKLVNATLQIRLPYIWGEGSVACASDSRKFVVRAENLKTEWHNRYRGRGIMLYWHVERKALAIYSQLKSPSSSEVTSMIEGVMRHATDMHGYRHFFREKSRRFRFRPQRKKGLVGEHSSENTGSLT
jgi:hypothetical protein